MLKMVQINNLYDAASRRRRLIIRFSILCLFAFFVAQVIPTLADEQDRSTELQSEIVPTESQTVNSESITTPIVLETEVPTPSRTPTTSATPIPANLTAGQGMNLEIPTSVSVDPRAQVAIIPRLRVSGPTYLLACLSSNNLVIDLLIKGSPDDRPASNLFLDGDLTSALTVSGPTDFVVSALNAVGGLRVSGLGRKLAGSTLRVAMVSVDKIAQDPRLCSKASEANIRAIKFSALGVDLGLKKGEVKLD